MEQTNVEKNKKQEELFYKFKGLESKLASLSGIVQNRNMQLTGLGLDYFQNDMDTLRKELGSLTKDVRNFYEG